MSAKIFTVLVDPSSQARGLVRSALAEDSAIEVVGSWDSLDAVIDVLSHPAEKSQPSVLVIDLELKNILDKIPELFKQNPNLKVFLIGKNTNQNVKTIISAMKLGVVDFVEKILPAENPSHFKKFITRLQQQIKAVEQSTPAAPVVPPVLSKKSASAPVATSAGTLQFQKKPIGYMPKVLAIASSTGGPNTLITMFGRLKGRRFSLPIFITQHMPKDFTAHFAKQLSEASGLPASEGKEGDIVEAGHIYVAPGDYHMGVKKTADKKFVIKLNQGPPENFCRPAADPMMRSLIESYGGNSILMLVVTGMGADGLKGAEQLVAEGGLVLAQDEATSVVWGMPGAVARHGLAHRLYADVDIPEALIEHSAGRIV